MSRRPDNPMINPADRVLFIDAEAIVIDKPAGLAVHAGPSTRSSLEDHLVGFRFGFHRPPTSVHRLDRDTSGCLLLARNPKAHKRFARAFDEGLVEKSYVAILAGVPDGSGGRIDDAADQDFQPRAGLADGARSRRQGRNHRLARCSRSGKGGP